MRGGTRAEASVAAVVDSCVEFQFGNGVTHLSCVKGKSILVQKTLTLTR